MPAGTGAGRQCGHHGVRPGVPGVDAVVFVDKGLIVATLSKAGGYSLGTVHRSTKAGILAVVVKDKRLVSVLLSPQGAGYILGAIHNASALVVEAEDGGHTVAAGAALQRWGYLL